MRRQLFRQMNTSLLWDASQQLQVVVSPDEGVHLIHQREPLQLQPLLLRTVAACGGSNQDVSATPTDSDSRNSLQTDELWALLLVPTDVTTWRNIVREATGLVQTISKTLEFNLNIWLDCIIVVLSLRQSLLIKTNVASESGLEPWSMKLTENKGAFGVMLFWCGHGRSSGETPVSWRLLSFLFTTAARLSMRFCSASSASIWFDTYWLGSWRKATQRSQTNVIFFATRVESKLKWAVHKKWNVGHWDTLSPGRLLYPLHPETLVQLLTQKISNASLYQKNLHYIYFKTAPL